MLVVILLTIGNKRTLLLLEHIEAFNNLSIKQNNLQEECDNYKNELLLAANAENPKLVAENDQLKNELSLLKTESSESYKANATNAQRVLTLLDSNQFQSTTISNIELELAKSKKIMDSNFIKITDLQELLKEKDCVIEILKDELSAHQLELVLREQDLKLTRAKLKTVEDENISLLERWMKLKSQEANKMNEANDFVETALKSKASLIVPAAASLMKMFQKVSSRSIDDDKNDDKKKLDTEIKENAYKSILPRKLTHKFVI
jgi:autophagy-related protein 16